jgi:hypothetical protein
VTPTAAAARAAAGIAAVSRFVAGVRVAAAAPILACMAAGRHPISPRSRQRGWAGLIALLLALLIVAWLGRTLLAKLLPAPATTVTTRGHGDARGSGGTTPADADATSATPAPRNELERARGLEAEVRKDAAEQEKRIDAATQ